MHTAAAAVFAAAAALAAAVVVAEVFELKCIFKDKKDVY